MGVIPEYGGGYGTGRHSRGHSVVFSMLISLAIALPAGTTSALRRNTWADLTASTGAMLGGYHHT